MMRSLLPAAAFLLASVLSAAAPAGDLPVDPLLRGPSAAPAVPPPGLPAMHEDRPSPALLRAHGLDDAGIRALEARGLGFRRKPAGGLVAVGDTYVVDALPSVLRRLAAEGWGLRVARPLDLAFPPTRVTGPEIEVDALIAAGATPLDGWDGEGIAVMDVDSGVDPFHPHLFRADGGAFSWVDVEGDGRLDPGEDGVDLDGDGEIDGDEVLSLMDGWHLEFDTGDWDWMVVGQDEELDPAADFLWQDADGDGRRDHGSAEGFTEDDPAYGERIYVPDDADSDGRLDPEERLLLLSTSRIRVVWTQDLTPYRRGENLVDFPVDVDSAGHGTGVLGIVGGGRPHPLSTYPGLLPEVDLLLYAYAGGDEADFAGALDLAQDEDVDVLLFELAAWTGHHLDGSEHVERTIDDLAEEGIAQVCPAGNLAGAGKHTSQAEQDGRLSFGFHVPVSDAYGSYWFVGLEMHVAANSFAVTDCVLASPDGQEFAVGFDGDGPEVAEGVPMYSQDSTSSRGSDLYQVWLWSQDGDEVVPAGDWRLQCSHSDAAHRLVHFFVVDTVTSWSRGVWVDDEQDASTLCWPSSADSCISVGASVGRIPTWEDVEAGALHGYSSRGPRMDGGKTIDVVAPADAYTPSPDGANSWISSEPGAYTLFGGTSGAGPHVAALSAQLAQARPDASGLEIRDMLRAGALVDSQVGLAQEDLPDDSWGWGKARGYRALDGSNADAGPDVPVEVDVVFDSRPEGDRCRVSASGEARGHGRSAFRWDLDYDGAWDSGFEQGEQDWLADPGSALSVRVDAADGGWWLGGAAFSWTVPDDCWGPGWACGGCALRPAPGGGRGHSGRTALALLLAAGIGARRRR